MVARSFTLRAVIALALLALFYASALATGFGLIGLGLWSLGLKTINVLGTFLLITAGFAVLVGLFPSFSTWRPPGVRVDERSQPKLFSLVRQIASEMAQPLPEEVYLIPEANAFVAQVGGVLGVGGKRVLGLGVVLLELTNVSQLKAILAHEFGHFAGGDARLSAITNIAREAMIRTLDNAARSGGSFALHPLTWIFRLYLRITQAISRQQELIADEWAVRIAGKTAHASALRQVYLGGETWSYFLRSEVEPLAARGVSPIDLFAAFRSFSTSTTMKNWEGALNQHFVEKMPDAFDSHPPLPERIARAHAQATESAMNTSPATSLLDDRATIDAEIFEAPEGAEMLHWDEVGAIYARDLERNGARAQVRVEGMSVQVALEVLAEPSRRDEFAEEVAPILIAWTLPDRKTRIDDCVVGVLLGYLGTLLTEKGYSWKAAPGERLWLQKGVTPLQLEQLLKEILEGKKPLDALTAVLDEAGVGRSDALPVDDELRSELEGPRSEVRLEPRGSSVIVLVNVSTFLLPRCCAICMKDAAQVTTAWHSGFVRGEGFYVDIPTCEAHQHSPSPLSLRSFRPMIGEAGFEMKNQEYAELIRTVNG